MKQFEVEVHVKFIGTVKVEAKSKKEALEIVEKDFKAGGLREIQNCENEAIVDWNMPFHPEIKLVSISLSDNQNW